MRRRTRSTTITITTSNRHDDRIRAFTLATERAIPAATFEMFLDLLRSMHGPNLLRLKGIVKLAETPGRSRWWSTACSTLPSARDGSPAGRTTTAARAWCSSPAISSRERSATLFDAFLGASARRPAGSRRARRQSAGPVRRRRTASVLATSRPLAPTDCVARWLTLSSDCATLRDEHGLDRSASRVTSPVLQAARCARFRRPRRSSRIPTRVFPT